MKRYEDQSALRIVDANANRLREGLRVIEEVARFHLDHKRCAAALKAMRTRLTQGLSRLEKSCESPLHLALLTARDSTGDVGRGPVSGGRRRRTTTDVLTANFKRVEEAARVLEEYAALFDPTASERFEQIRYAAYDMEAELVPTTWRAEALAGARLCVLVTESIARGSLLPTVRAAIRGGAQMIQYRNKELDDRTFADRAGKVLRACRTGGAVCILNDRVHIAAAIGADGVHLGPHDMPPTQARKVLGPHQLIGVSASTLAAVHAAQRAGVDYLGVGSVFPTPTKDASGGQPARTRGLTFVRRACEIARVPVYGIGGITARNAAAVAKAGCERVAVCSEVIGDANVEAATRRVLKALRRGRTKRRSP